MSGTTKRLQLLGSFLPEVTADDNNKILMVENGEWVAVPSTRFVKNKVAISSFSVTPSERELGETVNSVTLKWTTNMPVVAQTLTGETLTADERSKTITPETPYSSTKTWTLKVTDEQGEVSEPKTATLSFLNRVYYGAAAIPETLDGTFVLGLKDSELTSTKSRDITITADEGQYMWYVLPKQFGTCSFKVGGFEGGFTLVDDAFEFTNGKGYTNPNGYRIYRSTNSIKGETPVVIV